MTMFTRRGAVLTFLSLPLVSLGPDEARAATQGTTKLLRLASAFGAAEAALVALAQGIERLSTGGWSRETAHQLQTRLTSLLSTLESVYSQQTDLIAALDRYHSLWGPDDYEGAQRYRALSRADRLERRRRHWKDVASMVALMLANVSRTLGRLRSQQSAFVDPRAYERLERALGQRHSLLRSISRMSPPASAAEFAALQTAIARYEALHEALRRTVEATSAYIARLA